MRRCSLSASANIALSSIAVNGEGFTAVSFDGPRVHVVARGKIVQILHFGAAIADVVFLPPQEEKAAPAVLVIVSVDGTIWIHGVTKDAQRNIYFNDDVHIANPLSKHVIQLPGVSRAFVSSSPGGGSSFIILTSMFGQTWFAATQNILKDYFSMNSDHNAGDAQSAFQQLPMSPQLLVACVGAQVVTGGTEAEKNVPSGHNKLDSAPNSGLSTCVLLGCSSGQLHMAPVRLKGSGSVQNENQGPQVVVPLPVPFEDDTAVCIASIPSDPQFPHLSGMTIVCGSTQVQLRYFDRVAVSHLNAQVDLPIAPMLAVCSLLASRLLLLCSQDGVVQCRLSIPGTSAVRILSAAVVTIPKEDEDANAFHALLVTTCKGVFAALVPSAAQMRMAKSRACAPFSLLSCRAVFRSPRSHVIVGGALRSPLDQAAVPNGVLDHVVALSNGCLLNFCVSTAELRQMCRDMQLAYEQQSPLEGRHRAGLQPTCSKHSSSVQQRVKSALEQIQVVSTVCRQRETANDLLGTHIGFAEASLQFVQALRQTKQTSSPTLFTITTCPSTGQVRIVLPTVPSELRVAAHRLPRDDDSFSWQLTVTVAEDLPQQNRNRDSWVYTVPLPWTACAIHKETATNSGGLLCDVLYIGANERHHLIRLPERFRFLPVRVEARLLLQFRGFEGKEYVLKSTPRAMSCVVPLGSHSICGFIRPALRTYDMTGLTNISVCTSAANRWVRDNNSRVLEPDKWDSSMLRVSKTLIDSWLKPKAGTGELDDNIFLHVVSLLAQGETTGGTGARFLIPQTAMLHRGRAHPGTASRVTVTEEDHGSSQSSSPVLRIAVDPAPGLLPWVSTHCALVQAVNALCNQQQREGKSSVSARLPQGAASELEELAFSLRQLKDDVRTSHDFILSKYTERTERSAQVFGGGGNPLAPQVDEPDTARLSELVAQFQQHRRNVVSAFLQLRALSPQVAIF